MALLGCGHNEIHSILLSNASREFIGIIVLFLNLCFSHSFLPEDLLKGDVLPLIKDKKGNKFCSRNYRPIMKSSCILKLLEYHLLSIIEEKVNVSFNQFGFTKGNSTTDACFLLKEIINNNISKKSKVYAHFIDLSKAFDMVNYNLLINKLIDTGIPGDITKLIYVYLNNQNARIVWNNIKGFYKKINTGVRQGGILSPLLFKIYINELLMKFNELEQGCKLGISKLNILAYADDVVIFCNTYEGLNELFVELEKFLNNNYLKLNSNKSKVVIFQRKRQNFDNDAVILGNKEFELVPFYNYLGHIISYDLDDERDVKNKLDTFLKRFHFTFRNFNRLELSCQLYLFNAFSSPYYGLSLWNSKNIFRKSFFKTFHVCFSKALKMMVGCPKYSSSHNVADFCQQFLFKHGVNLIQVNYLHRMLQHHHSLININLVFLKNGLFFRQVYNNL